MSDKLTSLLWGADLGIGEFNSGELSEKLSNLGVGVADGWISVDEKEPTCNLSIYWVMFPAGNVELCRLNNYKQYGGVRNYWQDMGGDDRIFEGTLYIEHKKPNPPQNK